MRNFSSSCLLPWLPRQLNRAVWFSLPLVMSGYLYHLCSQNHDLDLNVCLHDPVILPSILIAPAQSSPTRPSGTAPHRQNASRATGEEPRQRTAFPSADNITSFFKTPAAFYTHQRVTSRIFVSTCLSGRTVF